MATAQEFARIWSGKLGRIKRLLRKLPRDVGNTALLWLLEQFKKQQDPEGKPWKPRKDGDGSRLLLVKTGRLRKSVKLAKVTSNSATISSNTPYSKFQNEGTNRLPMRKFIGGSAILTRRIQRFIRAKVLWNLRK